MSMVCEICGKHTSFGKKYARRGLARGKGGAGEKVTGKTQRTFRPNLQRVRAITPAGGMKRMRVCTSCLKAGKVQKANMVNKRKLTAAS